MKTAERIENALKKFKELFTLVSIRIKNKKEEDLLSKEFREKKLQMIEDLYKQIAELNKQFMFTYDSEFRTKEYVVKYESLKKQIADLEK